MARAVRVVRRRERARLRDRARQVTGLPRLRTCGATTVTGTGGPTLRISDHEGGGRVAGYAGLSTCGSVWSCPVCAAKVAARRADELATVIRHVLDTGGSASLVTLTMRHHRGDRLAACWDAAAKAWAAVTSGRGWVADQARGGLLGWAKVTEVTHGEHGWHVHIHALLCWDRPVSLEAAEYVGARMWQRWSNALARRGFASWADAGGMDVRMASLNADNLGDYFTKLAHELSAGHTKDGRRGGRTPFVILASAVDGLADDLERWWEWEQASHDRRQLTWSTGRHDLRTLAGLGREQSDTEIAEQDMGGDDVLALPAETWQQIRGSAIAVQLLEVAEAGGHHAARRWLAHLGLPVHEVTAAPPRRRRRGRLDEPAGQRRS